VPWTTLSEDRRALIEAGDAAVRWLRRGDSLERWREAGIAANELQAAAMEAAQTNVPFGRRYTAAWGELSAQAPHLRGLDKASRAHAIWLAANWEVVNTWLRTLAVNVRMAMNHPSAIRRRYDAAHRVPVDKPAARPRHDMRAQIIKLQEELELLRKRQGGEFLPRSVTPAKVSDLMFESHDAAWVRRLVKTLGERLAAEEQQGAIEARGGARRGSKQRLL
jgi:hypothetical protein